MYCPNSSSLRIDSVVEIAKNASTELVEQLQLINEAVLYERGVNLTELVRKNSTLFLLCEGQVELSIGDRTALIYEQGDLIGIESFLPIACHSVSKEFAIKAKAVSLISIEEKLGPRALLTLLSNFSAIFCEALVSNLPTQQEYEPKIQRFEDGEIIVEQGSFGDEIYTLIQGHAEAYVDGRKVGEVQCDEVFGALAAMTNIGRTATIKSSGKTLVLGINKDRLIELIKMRPGTVEKLIGDLARVIQDLNKKLAGSKLY